jgi:hypothetical protein
MWSNGLGVCRIPNAGSRSICRNRTIPATRPPTELTVPYNIISPLQGVDTVIWIITNIIGATITVTATTVNPVDETIAITPQSPTSLNGWNGITLTPGGTTSTIFTNVKVTLTGGRLPGGWTHAKTSADLNDFVMTGVLTLNASMNPVADSYFNMVDTPATFSITSTKSGTVSFLPPLSGVIFTDDSIVADISKAFPLSGITDGAYGEQKVIVTDSNSNTSTAITVTTLLNIVETGPAVAPNNNFIIDTVVPSAPGTPAAQSALTIIRIPLPDTTSTNAPFINALLPAAAAFTLGGAQGVTLTVVGAVVNQLLATDTPNITITLSSTTATGNDITVSYDNTLAGSGQEIRDAAGNIMANFSNLAIAIL